jgi:DNA-binding transcriptional LysR family regulator
LWFLDESPSIKNRKAERESISDLIEFRHLRYLIAVAEEENISRAAKRLFVAQPSLSIQLKSMEDALSIELLVRVRKGVKLTPAAEVLIAGARQILALRDEVIAATLASHHKAIAPLRIGFSPFIDRALLQTVCSAHLALFPNCEITPKSGDSVELLSLLERGVIDAALLTLPANGIGLNIDQLSHDRLVVCMRSNDPAASLDEIAPSALEKKLKIFREPKQNPEGHRHLMELLDEVGVHPEVASTTSTPRDIQWMVKSGYGHALIREGSELEDGVVTRPVAGVNWAVDCALISKKSSSQRTIPALVRALRKKLRIPAFMPSKKPPQSVRLSAAKRTLPLFG